MGAQPRIKPPLKRLLGVVFTRTEIDRALAEMRSKEIFISSVSRDGIDVGFTQNPIDTRYVSAYTAGYWLGCLEISADGESYHFNDFYLPPWMLLAVGTPFEDEGRQLAARISSFDRFDDKVFEVMCGQAIDSFGIKLGAAGLLRGYRKDDSHDETTERTPDLRIALYCRHRYEKRLQDQVALCERWIADCGYSLGEHLVERYQDTGGDAGKPCDERPGFQRMLAGARAGRFDVLALTVHNRISPRSSEVLDILQTLKALGIRVAAYPSELDPVLHKKRME